MAEGEVGPANHEEVWDLGDGHGEVRRRPGSLDILHVSAVGNDGEPRHPRGIEACRADDHVGLVCVAVVVDEAGWGDFLDSTQEGGDLLGGEGFEESVAGLRIVTH